MKNQIWAIIISVLLTLIVTLLGWIGIGLDKKVDEFSDKIEKFGNKFEIIVKENSKSRSKMINLIDALKLTTSNKNIEQDGKIKVLETGQERLKKKIGVF